MTQERLKQLFDLYINRSATCAEEDELFSLVSDPEHERAVRQWMSDYIDQPQQLELLPEQTTASILKSILQEEEQAVLPSRRTGKMWMQAAAMVLILGISITIYLALSQKKPDVAIRAKDEDVLPGREGAVLTLSDGRRIVLDSLSNGVVSMDHGAAVQLHNGELVYDDVNEVDAPVYNTLSTPKGQQFNVQLPDGTRVWLNAASSIRYPIVFSKANREVYISGEAYFEVNKVAGKRFVVHLENQSSIEVLGTHFNVNAYTDEENIKTTLVEGSIKINYGSATSLLKPGEQAGISATVGHSSRANDGDGRVVNARRDGHANTEARRQANEGAGGLNVTEAKTAEVITILKNVDVSQVTAWKDGVFNLTGVPFAELMRQISRWYNIDVVYEGGIPEVEFRGKMGRDVTLSRLLYFLEGTGIKFRIEKEMKKLVLIK